MTLGGLLIVALIVAVVLIYYKVRENSKKIEELEGGEKKLKVKE